MTVEDTDIAAAVIALVQQRGAQSSACPSELARQLAPRDWRALMPRVRAVASRLAAQGRIDITQGGAAVPAQGPWRGPIRLRLPQAGQEDRGAAAPDSPSSD